MKLNAAAREIVQMPDIFERYASLTLEPVRTNGSFLYTAGLMVWAPAGDIKRAGP